MNQSDVGPLDAPGVPDVGPLDAPMVPRSAYGRDFVWGVATAAYQIEGAWDADGKGPSVWDTFCHSRVPVGRFGIGRSPVRDGDTGDVACDFYHRYADDIALVSGMGFGAKRFSISWPRVLPLGTGPVNPAGLDFYDRVVDECLGNGVDPWITLFHWDLPQSLQDRGGWSNREILGWFEEYVGVVADRLGDRVKNWMVFNEPLSFLALGYLLGVHAPAVRSPRRFAAGVHHVNLCQGIGARVLRERVAGAVVGTTQYLSPVEATGDTRLHRRAHRAGDAFTNRIFVEPNLGLGYPEEDLPLIRLARPFQLDGDEEALKVDWDFLGVQYYTRLRTPPLPLPGMRTVPHFGRDHRRYPLTTMGWEVRPDGLFDILCRMHGYGRFPRLVVTESGLSLPDQVVTTPEGGRRVHDLGRIDAYRQYLEQVRRAQVAGVPVDGFFCWSLMDNFEWGDGYQPRFGLVHVDFATQERTVKDSGLWFRRFLGPAAGH